MEEKKIEQRYATEIEARTVIREINRYKGWKSGKHIKIKQQEQNFSLRRGQIQPREKQKQRKMI